MALYSDTSIQQLILRDAVCYGDLESTPLIIHFDARDGGGHGQLTLHLQNAPLALALAAAINETLKNFRATAKPSLAA